MVSVLCLVSDSFSYALTLVQPKAPPKDETEVQLSVKLPYLQADVLHEINNHVAERAAATRTRLAMLPSRVKTRKKHKHRHKKGTR